MAKEGKFAAQELDQGERDIDFPMSIRPNQSVLVNELKSKFEAIEERFDSLFERLKGSNLGNSSPKPVVSNSESQIIYNQISEVLEQWTGRHSQNYYELKHIFQLLNAFAKDQYQGDGLNLVLKRAGDVLAASKTSWNFVRKSTVSGDLRDLGFCVDPPKISFRPSRPFRRGCRLGMRGPVIRKRTSHPPNNQ